MKSGIYIIRCLVSNKNYVGSSVNVYNRWYLHQGELNAGMHHNKHLQASWNKYGASSFVFYVIEFVESSDLLVRERRWIEHLDSCNPAFGFNRQPIPDQGNRGVRFTEEARANISRALCAFNKDAARKQASLARRRARAALRTPDEIERVRNNCRKAQKLALLARTPASYEASRRASRTTKQNHTRQPISDETRLKMSLSAKRRKPRIISSELKDRYRQASLASWKRRKESGEGSSVVEQAVDNR